MALEFAIFRVEADACTWQESPRRLAAAKARAELPGAVASSLVYKRASRKAPRACLPAVLASALLLLCMVSTRAIAQQQIAVREMVHSIREAIARDHDIAAREIVLIRPGTLPKTTSGKIQRHHTRQMFLSRTLAVLQ